MYLVTLFTRPDILSLCLPLPCLLHFFLRSRAEHGCRSTPHTKLPSELTSTSPNPPGALTTYHGTSLSCQTTTPAINSPEQIPPSPPRPPSRQSPFPVLRSNRPSDCVDLDLLVLTGLPTAALPRRSDECRRSLLPPPGPLRSPPIPTEHTTR